MKYKKKQFYEKPEPREMKRPHSQQIDRKEIEFSRERSEDATSEVPWLLLIDIDLGNGVEGNGLSADLALEVVQHQLLV